MKTLADPARHVALAIALALAALPAWALDLQGLMGLIGQRQSGEANFTEQRYVRGLDAPLESSGVLSFVAPDRLMRRTLKPRAEAMAVEGNTVTLSRNGRSRSFALDATPEMVALIEAIRGTLTGNAATLTKYFRTQVDGSAERWTLALTPIEPQLASSVRAVTIGGQQGEVRSVELQLAGGDRSVMQIEPSPAAGARPASSP